MIDPLLNNILHFQYTHCQNTDYHILGNYGMESLTVSMYFYGQPNDYSVDILLFLNDVSCLSPSFITERFFTFLSSYNIIYIFYMINCSDLQFCRLVQNQRPVFGYFALLSCCFATYITFLSNISSQNTENLCVWINVIFFLYPCNCERCYF